MLRYCGPGGECCDAVVPAGGEFCDIAVLMVNAVIPQS